MIDNVFQTARQQWESAGVQLLPAVDEEDVLSAFAELGMPLSEDVMQLYSIIGGFEYGSTHGVWSLWGLDQLRRENLCRDRADQHIAYVWFADYLIFSHVYACRFESTRRSSVYAYYYNFETAPIVPVAESIDEFLQKYLDDPDSVEAFWL